MNTESFLSLGTFKKFFVFISLVKVTFSGFLSLYFDLQLQAVVYLRVVENLYITVMALVGFSTSAALAYQPMGTIWGRWTKRRHGALCFIMALGLFWDIVTGLPWTPSHTNILFPCWCQMSLTLICYQRIIVDSHRKKLLTHIPVTDSTKRISLSVPGLTIYPHDKEWV